MTEILSAFGVAAGWLVGVATAAAFFLLRRGRGLSAEDLESERLLLAWLAWQQETDGIPGKLPDSIHTRTAVHLTVRHLARGADFEEALRAERERIASLPAPEPRLYE